MNDYDLVLKEFGISPSQADAIIQNMADQVGMPRESLVEVKPSTIHGQGIFVTQDVFAGTLLVMARIAGFRTPAGRYTNHERSPNSLMVKDRAGDIQLVAMKDLTKGSEVTISYRQSGRIR